MKNKLFIISLLLTCIGSGYAQRIVCDSTCKIEYGGDTSHSAVNYAFVNDALFSTITNANFDAESIYARIDKGLAFWGTNAIINQNRR